LGGLRGLTGSARTAGGFAWLSVVGCGCNEEGNLVVAPAASLRRYHPCEQTDARSGPGSSAEWKGLRSGEVMARLKPCPFDGLGWVRLVWQHANPTRDQVLSRMGHPGVRHGRQGLRVAVVCRGGGIEEGNLVVSPAAALRRYHPCEQTDARSGPGSSAEWKGLRPGEFMARLKPCAFDGLGW
jgi:hypothetical protein